MIVISIIALIMVAAVSPNERVGDRLIIPAGPGTMYYDAGVPFHLAHGWFSQVGLPAVTTMRGSMRIELDGEDIPHDFSEISRQEIGGTVYLLNEFIFNFPAGMTGTHTFDLYYSNICSFWLEGGYIEEGDKPNEILEMPYPLRSWEVIFQ